MPPNKTEQAANASLGHGVEQPTLENDMACPKCGCKVHYQYDSGWDGVQPFENLERCASCGEVFDIEDSTEEEDDDD